MTRLRTTSLSGVLMLALAACGSAAPASVPSSSAPAKPAASAAASVKPAASSAAPKLAASAGGNHVTIAGLFTGMNAAPLMISVEKDYFKEQGLDVETVPTAGGSEGIVQFRASPALAAAEIPSPTTGRAMGAEQTNSSINIADKATVFLALFRSAESSIGVRGTDADVKAFFESIQVRQEHDRAVLDASVSTPFLRKLLAEPASELTPPAALSPTEKLPANSR